MSETAQKYTHNKVLILGLDGGSPHVIRRLTEQGHMPFLKSVIEKGSFGSLQSVYPPATPPAWSTFMTGKNPGGHSVFEFSTYDGYDKPLRVVNGRSVQCQTLWSLLSRAEKRLGVVNVPMTYPPHQINGSMITGLFTPSTEQQFTYPSDLYTKLQPKLGDYIISVDWHRYPRRKIRKFLHDLSECTHQRTRYTLQLMKDDPWDFFMVVYSENDFLQHIAWSFFDPDDPRENDPAIEAEVLAYLNLLDQKMADLYETAGDDTLLLVLSDHGFGPLKRIVYINTWLAQQGYLQFESELVNRYRRTRGIRQFVRRIDPYKLRRFIPKKGNIRTDVGGFIDFSNTQAFSVLAGEQGIRINLKGREKNGTVEPGQEYESLRDAIIEQLTQLQDPATGKTIGTCVRKREEVYSGPYLEQACDIVFILDDLNYLADVLPEKDIFADANWDYGAGTHRMDGLLAACGPGIQSDAPLEGAMLQDIMPTILYALDVPIPDDVDGKVLTQLFDEKSLERRPPAYESADAPPDKISQADEFCEDDERMVIERLKGLGYIS